MSRLSKLRRKPASETERAEQSERADQASTLSNERAYAMAAVVAIPVFVTLGYLGYQFWPRPVFSEKPIVVIDMQILDKNEEAAARPIEDDIMVGLSRFQTLRLTSGNMGERALYTLGIPAASTGGRASIYRVTLRYSRDQDGQMIWWQVVDEATREVLRSGAERVPPSSLLDDAPSRELARKVTVTLAGRHGIIANLETARELVAPSLGNGCVLRAVSVADGLVGKASAVRCLSDTLALTPNDADANAMLAILMASDDASRALELANQAVALAPLSDRAKMSQSIALFANGKIDAAIAAGYQAMTLNPYNGILVAKLGSMVFLSGRWEEGVALVQKSGLTDSDSRLDAAMTLALDAYRTGRFNEAMLRVSQMDHRADMIVDILAAAALGQQNKVAEAADAIETIRKRRLDFATSFRADLQARHYAPALIDALQAGLVKAGLQIQ